MSYTVTSLFSGCGGLDLGFRGNFKSLGKYFCDLDFETVFANDIEKNACLTYSRNLNEKIVCGDINALNSDFVFAKTDVVLGGFPCQDFSHAGKRKGFNSERGLLYKTMSSVIKMTEPKLFVAENVKGLLTMDGGDAFNTILEEFETLGYHLSYKLFKVSDYGVPQKRERVIIVGTKKGVLPDFDIESISPVDFKVFSKDAIGDLEDIEEGDFTNHFWSKAKKNKGQGNRPIQPNDFSPTIRAEHHGNIEFHWNEKRRLSAREVARLQSFPDDFVFYPSTSSAYKQIGNAVPPVFAWHVAKSVQGFLRDNL